jgi:hypothetical protein
MTFEITKPKAVSPAFAAPNCTKATNTEDTAAMIEPMLGM